MTKIKIIAGKVDKLYHKKPEQKSDDSREFKDDIPF